MNGMAVLSMLRADDPSLQVTETHPKVLYYAIAKEKYRYSTATLHMNDWLSQLIGLKAIPRNDHEWDALFSVHALHMGIEGVWDNDLHQLSPDEKEALVHPCGTTNYWWPC